MGFNFIFLTMCLYLAWFTWPLKSMSFQEVFKIEEMKKSDEDPTKTSQSDKRVQGIGSNENNLYLHKVLNKKVLNDFAMVKKKAFYITPPFELHGKVTTHSYHAEETNLLKKDLLEQFTMKRKEAFYITPPFDYESITPEPDTEIREESSDTGSDKENNLDQEEPVEKQDNLRAKNEPDAKSVLDMQENLPSKDKEKPKPVIDEKDLKNSVQKIANGSVISNDTDKVAAKSYDYDITFNPNANQFVTPYIARNQADNFYQNVTDLTNKQASIVNQLTNLGGDKDEVNKYNQQFDALMKALQAQKAWASSTVIIMLDETDVKNKLRGDPFVQRVLKMAKRRKDEYFKRAKAEAIRNLRTS